MSGLQIVVTTAGRAALVNAQNTGTLPVLIAQIGVTAQAFAANKDMTALPGETKRLDTFGGNASDDTIHVTISDNSAATYLVRGFALYLDDGTLFALYGQETVIVEKSQQSIMQLAADVIFTDIPATSITFGDTNFFNPPATTEVQGVLELATNAEGLAGLDTRRGIVSSVLKYVLDQRFGLGAPSDFVKSLLTVATAAAMRLALELKGAALKDMGHTNGLDADLLDGQHGAYYRDWANLTNKPATFTPSAHTHAFDSLTAIPETATRWPAWGEVTGKPALAPAVHTHQTLTIGAYLTGDDYNGGTARTIGVDATTAATANKVVARDGAGDLFARLVRIEYSVTNPTIGYIMTMVETGAGANNYIRPSTPAQVKAAMQIVIGDVGGLPAALGEKAPLASPRFSGNVGIGAAAVAPLDVETGSGRVLFRAANDVASIDSVKSGNSAFAPLNIRATALTLNNGTVWHAGNFNPASKSDVGHKHDAADIASGILDVARLGLAQSLATNGYCKLPNGLILQWGRYTNPISESSNVTVNFPAAFPNACYVAIPVTRNLDASTRRDVNMQVVGDPTKTGFTTMCQWTGVDGTWNNTDGFFWFAVGA